MSLVSCSVDGPTNIEPTLTTAAADSITRHSATLHGLVGKNEDAAMPELFFRYGTTQAMDTEEAATASADNHVQLTINGLTAGTTYYFALQGRHGQALLQGTSMAFTTIPNDKPTVGTCTILSSGPTSVIVGYDIEDDGGEEITETGCYFSTINDANAASDLAVPVSKEGSSYKATISGLLRNTVYYIWPYAVSRAGKTVGQTPLVFTTSDAVLLGEAGTLAALMDNSVTTLTSITVSGNLNGDDLCFLRRMAGRDNDGSDTGGTLTDIDLTDAHIKSGGGSYDGQRYSADNVIGQGLFASCTRLRSVSLPADAQTIEKDAFKDCVGMTMITVPASVTSLTPSDGCTSLASITVSEANAHYRSDEGVLFDAAKTSLLWFPKGKTGHYTMPSTVTTVGDYAFKGSSITSITMPDALVSIGQAAFHGSKVETVEMPSQLRTIPTATFQDCGKLTTVKLGANTELISEYAFDGCPLAHLYVEAVHPPVCYAKTFASTSTDFTKTCTLHVPKGCKPLYRNNSYWKVFTNIVEE